MHENKDEEALITTALGKQQVGRSLKPLWASHTCQMLCESGG